MPCERARVRSCAHYIIAGARASFDRDLGAHTNINVFICVCVCKWRARAHTPRGFRVLCARSLRSRDERFDYSRNALPQSAWTPVQWPPRIVFARSTVRATPWSECARICLMAHTHTFSCILCADRPSVRPSARVTQAQKQDNGVWAVADRQTTRIRHAFARLPSVFSIDRFLWGI